MDSTLTFRAFFEYINLNQPFLRFDVKRRTYGRTYGRTNDEITWREDPGVYPGAIRPGVIRTPAGYC